MVAAATVTARGQRGDGNPPSPRAARIHVTYDGPATTGSRLMPGARESFAAVILARVTAGTWQRLAPIVDPAPKSSPLPGRVHVVQDGDAHPAQVPLMTDAEGTTSRESRRDPREARPLDGRVVRARR
ncbi:hypothetical protein OV320_1940 [Actinobacteria bacterium OV320]|nr:hypothetical protein OV320_1940 [Actinobacteria bacterium OV320]